MKFTQFVVAVITLQVTVSNPIANYKQLSPEEAANLAAWTPNSKQQAWELSGQFEGDMILTEDQRNGLIEEHYRWPNNELPYEFSSDFNEQQKGWITQLLHIEYGKTCINVRSRTSNDIDYVYVTGSAPGCFAQIGHVGGPQVVNLNISECLWQGTVVHEFLHALGFAHQQSAVDILWDNILEKERHNFQKYIDLTSFGQKYDYDSVMHYGRYAFSSNGLPTILPKDPSAGIGQIIGLSKTDIIKLHKMYKCEICM